MLNQMFTVESVLEDNQLMRTLQNAYKLKSHDAFLIKKIMYYGLGTDHLKDYIKRIQEIGLKRDNPDNGLQ
jgi:hypothetical protein